jgi:hypothetical protein
MSTTAPAPETADVTTFRGRSLEELLPQIREQLGPDAIVLRQRDGLMGGIGGFFQQRFVEIDARSGAPRIDVYDEEPEPSPESFAQLLADADVAAAIGAAATSAETLTAELQRAGTSASFAVRLIADAEAHELPFADGDLREATRRAFARRLPTALPHRAGGLAVAFAGPGSTGCADALASAYKRAGRDSRAVASLDRVSALLERGNPDAIVAVDLPPVAAERGEVAALAARVEQLDLDELIAVLPADLDLPTARQLLDRLQPLNPTALALSLDAQDAQVAAALELACTTRLPIAYVQADGAIAPADPHTLAERLLR